MWLLIIKDYYDMILSWFISQVFFQKRTTSFVTFFFYSGDNVWQITLHETRDQILKIIRYLSLL